jgi:hypothetical protein
MKALIDPSQNNLVVEVAENEFEVANPLYWVDCPDTIVAYQYQYIDNEFVPYTAPVEVPTAEENKSTAVSLLQATDWTQIPSVSDPALSNPYLSNKLAFDQYRNEVRQYAVYPVAGNITWPTVPTENWVKV